MAALISRHAGYTPPSRTHRAHASVSFSLLIFALVTSVFCPRAFAQETTETDDLIRVETNLVTIPVFVTDAAGRRVQGLTQNDFSLRDNDATVEVAYFAAGAERVALAFLLDASGSTRDHIARQQETALALLSRFGERSRVAVLRFWEQAELTVPFTNDRHKLSEAFRLPAIINRRTAIFDAARAALRTYEKSGSDPTERRIVILISDGLDTVSTTRAEAVIEEARARGVSFYVVHLPLYTPRDGRLVPRPTAKGFRQLATETGGQFFTVGDAASALDARAGTDLAPIFQAIADDLQGQYVLGFYASSDARRERAHRVEVRLASKERRKLRVRSLRAGYILSR